MKSFSEFNLDALYASIQEQIQLSNEDVTSLERDLYLLDKKRSAERKLKDRRRTATQRQIELQRKNKERVQKYRSQEM